MNFRLLVTGGVAVALVAAIWRASEHFVGLQVPDLSAQLQTSCIDSQDAQSEARWERAGRNGYITGRGSLILQKCTAGTWTLDVAGISLNGVAPRLLIESGSDILFDRTIDKDSRLSVQVKAGFPLALTVPNALVKLEDRNLYISDYRFTPDIPCLQNPPQLSSKNIGILSVNRANLTNNGSFFMTACGDGKVSFTLTGSNLQSVGPKISIDISGAQYYLGFIQANSPKNFNINLHKNDRLGIVFSNDGAITLGERTIKVKNSSFR
ncbi:hypothetical protein [Deinococcus sp.]|uniref:hypothetical protein n=1 Tax=Deinococcus sp. TaxID=47478 RepID=UPI003C7DCC1C